MSKESRWENFLDKIKLTRRSFLKVSAATAGAAAMSSLTVKADEELPTYEIPANTKPDKFTTGGEWFKNTCPRNCHDTCSIKTQVVDGKVIRIKGADNPYTGGNVCVKMNHYVNYLYHPDRLLYPMKRVGAKGEGKFERITWDEAYQAIVENTKEVIKEYGPNAIMQYFYSGTLGYVSNYSMPARYFNKIGATGCLGNICLATGATAIPYTYGAEAGVDPEQYANTSLYVSWGTNEAASGVHQVKFIKQCKENGGKIIVINTTPTPISEFADLYIRPKVGTDAALALGIANVLITENLYDKDFVEKYTHGFEQLKEQAANYTPEKASEITGVPAEDIIECARMYGTIKPSIMRIGYGMQRHTNGGSMIRAISFLPALVGEIGKGHTSGYAFFNDHTWVVDWDVLGSTHLNTNPNPRSINMIELSKALTGELETTKETPIKQLFVFVANPMTSTPNIEKTRKGLEREDLFTIVSDIFHTDTVDYADIVLPATTLFEQEDLNQDYLAWYIRYNEPAIEPLGEAKSNVEIFRGLAKAMGFTDPEFDLTTGEIIAETLEHAGEMFGGITYEELKEKHWHKVNPGVPYGDLKFATPSGKIEFYSESIQKDWGLHPVAEYVPTKESKEGNKELYAKYPLTFLTLTTKNFINGQMSQVEHIQAVNKKPVVFIHADDAKVRGIVDGERVIVKNDRGYTKLIAKITTEKVMPGVVLAYKSPWSKILKRPNINATTSEELSDIGYGSTFHTNLVDVVKEN